MKPLGLKYAVLGLGSLAGLTLAVSAQQPVRGHVLKAGPDGRAETIVPVHVNEHQLLLPPPGPELGSVNAPPPLATAPVARSAPLLELPPAQPLLTPMPLAPAPQTRPQGRPFDFRQALIEEATQEGFARKLAAQNLTFDENTAAQRNYLSQVGVIEYARELARLRAREDYEAQRRLIRQAAAEQADAVRAPSFSSPPPVPARLTVDAESPRPDLERQLRMQQLQLEALESSTPSPAGPWHQVKAAGAWIADHLPFRSVR